jgi:hypothetical protein
MPISYKIEWESGLIHTRCVGFVTFEEVAGHFRELDADPLVPPRLDVLLDMSEMSSLPETPQLKDVAVELERLQGRVEWGAWAIVASGDALFGMSRMFQVFAERNFPVSRVFRDLGEARSWLASVALDPV